MVSTTVLKILRELRTLPSKALAFFQWAAAADPTYAHGSTAYNAMARVLARQDSAAEFWVFVDRIRADGFEVDIDSYVKLSRQFLKGKRTEDAVRLYEFMMDGQYKPTVQDCGMLLRQISFSLAPDIQIFLGIS